MFQIIFTFPRTKETVCVTVGENESILEGAQKANVPIDAPCSGNGSCGKCRVQIQKGRVRRLPDSHLTEAELAEGWCLSCCSYPESDLEVLVPELASAYRQSLKIMDLSDPRQGTLFAALPAALEERGLSLSNAFRRIPLHLTPPTPEDTMPDSERLLRALALQLPGRKLRLPYCVMTKLPEVLRNSDFSILVTGEEEENNFLLYDICPLQRPDPLCGLAVDIGTTTVSCVLFDLETGELLAAASGGNGQIRYGADVIHRILMQTKEGGKERLQEAILQETLLPLIQCLCQQGNRGSRQILRAAIAANPTMNHLLLGIPADPLRTDPYVPAFFTWDDLRASDLSLPLHPEARIRLAPNVGSYVGGDITAGVLSSLLWEEDALSLLIDLGTNGELVLGNRDFMVTCACSAGPAFEGGDISCGMRATDGAIEACTIDPVTLEPSFRVIGPPGQKPWGLCGSGIIDIIAQLFLRGIINAKGLFVGEGPRIRHDAYGCGRYILSEGAESATGRELAITEVDIGNFIRAKAAVYSAIDTLLCAMDLEEGALERIYVAGGIGGGIHIENAIAIGMFPNLDPRLYRYIGNSALTGAYAIARSDGAWEKTQALARNMTYVELSSHPGYMDAFVAACFLPHTDAARFTTEGSAAL